MLDRLKSGVQQFASKTHILGLVLVLLVIAIYVWHLGSLTPGLSSAEVQAAHSSQSITDIVKQPVNAPQRIVQYGFQSAGWHSAGALRLTSTLFALGFLVSFYIIARNWFGKQSGALGVIVLASTPWLIINSRSATPAILLLTPVILLSVYLWLATTKKHRTIAWYCFCLVIGLALYVPGMIWLIAAGWILARKRIRTVSKDLRSRILLTGFLLVLIIISPLIWAVIRDWTVVKPILLMPAHFEPLANSLKSILWSTASLFWRTPYHVDFTIGRWPLLDSLQLVLALFGGFAMWGAARQVFLGLLATIVLAITAAGLNQDNLYLLMALPAIGVFMVAGLRYLYLEWRTVFPKNPIPQTLALTLISVLVFTQLFFGMHYALTAWPNTIGTKTTYVLKYNN